MQFGVMTIILAAIWGLLVTPVQAAGLEYGFMDTKWSTPAKELNGFAKVGGSEKMAYYVKPQRTYTFFGSEVPNKVVHGFYDDKFFAVYVVG